MKYQGPIQFVAKITMIGDDIGCYVEARSARFTNNAVTKLIPKLK